MRTIAWVMVAVGFLSTFVNADRRAEWMAGREGRTVKWGPGAMHDAARLCMQRWWHLGIVVTDTGHRIDAPFERYKVGLPSSLCLKHKHKLHTSVARRSFDHCRCAVIFLQYTYRLYDASRTRKFSKRGGRSKQVVYSRALTLRSLLGRAAVNFMDFAPGTRNCSASELLTASDESMYCTLDSDA